MVNLLETARLFSGGKFDEAANRLSDEVEFNIYEDKKHLTGKIAVLEFCKGISEYFATIETNLNSCDVYEFNASGLIVKIHSYCNSKQQ